ncbi:MAG: amino acid permease [Rhizobiales bacterium]|nr:amino acid permease [Hyphomicrobiales bacterium]
MKSNQQVLATDATDSEPRLKRSLNLPLLVLYGLGTTIGAGIYVLVGAAAGRSGMYAPFAFVAAAIAVAPSAASYAELAGRFPVSAGEAAYVNAGFKSRYLSMLTGLLVVVSGVVASATIAIGCAGYVRTFIDLPLPVAVTGVIVVMGLVAAWGILESVLLAALFTLIEAGGLIILISAGFTSGDDLMLRLPETLPAVADLSIWFGIANAGLLAIFAFIGFEDMVNVAEETKKPGTTMPWAIFLTLAITAVLYILVTFVAVTAVPPSDLARSEAPLSVVFEKLTGMSPVAISAIAVFATLNTILVQFIMASRVIYGMAGQGNMPAVFSRVSATTHTPLLATAVVVGFTWVLAIAFPLERLAEVTSILILFIWALANMALIIMKLRQDRPPFDAFVVPMWVPVSGLLLSGALIFVSIAG